MEKELLNTAAACSPLAFPFRPRQRTKSKSNEISLLNHDWFNLTQLQTKEGRLRSRPFTITLNPDPKN